MRHVLTLIANEAHATLRTHASLIASLRARLNPVRIVWLSDYACDLECDARPHEDAYTEALALAHNDAVDAVLQPMAHRSKRLLVSDMDSTMIAQECIDELADAVGMKAHVSAITERAMNGELDFETALRERVALLKNLPISKLEDTWCTRITLMPGAGTLVATMKAQGAHTLLVSGGFTFFTSRVAAALGFDHHEANELLVTESVGESNAHRHHSTPRPLRPKGCAPLERQTILTGMVAEPILGKEAKRSALMRVADEHRIPLSQSLAVGDGANDLPMILSAGLGVAYHAKPLVEALAPACIRYNDLTALLYVQGVPKTQWRI